MRWLSVVIAGIAVGGVALASLLFPRDGILTTNIQSFEPYEIVKFRMWEEHPVQVLNSFFVKESTKIYGLGGDDTTSQSLAKRLSRSFGEQYVFTDSSFIDLYSGATQEERDRATSFFDEYAYFANLPCPHDESSTCLVGVGWNRDYTKQPNVSLYFIRATADTYVFVDRSLLEAN